MTNGQNNLREQFSLGNTPFANSTESNCEQVLKLGAEGIDPYARQMILRIETSIAQYATASEQKALWVIDPQVQTGRCSFPIILAPQRVDKHEFDVAAHCEWAAWSVSNFYSTVYRHLPADLQGHPVIADLDLQSRIGNYRSLTVWTITAFLHDIEKFFEARKEIVESSPWQKNTHKSAKRDALTQKADCTDFSGFEVITRLFIVDEMSAFPVALQGILHDEIKLLPEIFELYKIYEMVDGLIKQHGNQFEVNDEQLRLTATEINQINNPSVKARGILLMAADNFAQGLPSSGDSTTINERIRNFKIVILLLRECLFLN